jgi:hypothetical protein
VSLGVGVICPSVQLGSLTKIAMLSYDMLSHIMISVILLGVVVLSAIKVKCYGAK